MDVAEITRRMERERLFWVDVAPGKRIQLIRPMLDEARGFAQEFTIAKVATYLRDWSGVVESDILAAGGSTPVDFDKGLATNAVRDHLEWGQKVMTAVATAVADRAALTSAVEKKPETSSTSTPE